ncbi:MAG TPA: hypothetical protein VIQ30_17945, partial [Pseudonocardia sp.]
VRWRETRARGVEVTASAPRKGVAADSAAPVPDGSDPIAAASTRGIAHDGLLQALNLAERGLQRLHEHGKHWESSDDPYGSVSEKIIVETSLLAMLAARVADDGDQIHDSVTRVAELLQPLARTPAKAALIVKHPHTALPFGITHVALEKIGFPDPRFSSILRAAFESGHVHHVERLPYRRLEVAWLLALWDDAVVDSSQHRDGSIIYGRPHPIHMSVGDVYALTHTLFYATDFGRHEVPAAVDVEAVSQCLDACLSWQLFEENVDTVGELLMSSLLLPLPASPVVLTCWNAINALREEFGFLPGPSFDARRYGELTGAERDAYAFQHNYHTMYVGGLLSAMVLRRGTQVRVEPRGRAAGPGDSFRGKELPYWVRLAARNDDGMSTAVWSEARTIQQARAGAYADLQRSLAEESSHTLSPATLAHARELVARHVAMTRHYGRDVEPLSPLPGATVGPDHGPRE